eukprot:scaffold47677_cov15-Prasinocladus_malaysianus.AAC.1
MSPSEHWGWLNFFPSGLSLEPDVRLRLGSCAATWRRQGCRLRPRRTSGCGLTRVPCAAASGAMSALSSRTRGRRQANPHPTTDVCSLRALCVRYISDQSI